MKRPAGDRDEVDRLLGDWRRERPDVDVSALEVMSRLARLARRLERARRSVLADHDLEQWGFDVLAALRRAGPPYSLAPRLLIRETLVTSGTMTNRIDRLEEAGLVAREPDPSDRRGVLVRLLPPGRERVDACLESLVAEEETLLRPLSPADRRALAGLLREMLAPLDRDR